MRLILTVAHTGTFCPLGGETLAHVGLRGCQFQQWPRLLKDGWVPCSLAPVEGFGFGFTV